MQGDAVGAAFFPFGGFGLELVGFRRVTGFLCLLGLRLDLARFAGGKVGGCLGADQAEGLGDLYAGVELALYLGLVKDRREGVGGGVARAVYRDAVGVDLDIAVEGGERGEGVVPAVFLLRGVVGNDD